MSLPSPEIMSLRGRAGAFAKHAKHPTKESTTKARAAFNRRFENQVDPDRVLPAEERQRLAEYARKAYMASLAIKSAKSRRRKAGSA